MTQNAKSPDTLLNLSSPTDLFQQPEKSALQIRTLAAWLKRTTCVSTSIELRVIKQDSFQMLLN